MYVCMYVCMHVCMCVIVCSLYNMSLKAVGVVPIQGSPSDFWAEWILNAASKSPKIAD